jgi:hypothetical protein
MVGAKLVMLKNMHVGVDDVDNHQAQWKAQAQAQALGAGGAALLHGAGGAAPAPRRRLYSQTHCKKKSAGGTDTLLEFMRDCGAVNTTWPTVQYTDWGTGKFSTEVYATYFKPACGIGGPGDVCKQIF